MFQSVSVRNVFLRLIVIGMGLFELGEPKCLSVCVEYITIAVLSLEVGHQLYCFILIKRIISEYFFPNDNSNQANR